MARLNEKQTLLVIVGVTVVLCGAAGGGVYWAKDLIDQERLEIEAKEKKIAAANKKIEKIPGIESKVIVLRENVAQFVKILPQEAELTKFTRAAQKFGALSGISIDRFVPVRGGAKGGAFRRVSYQYYFKATLWQFMKFMNFFESYERFVRVRDFNLVKGKADKGTDDALHDIRMTVETYVYNPKTSGKETQISNYDAKRKQLVHEIEKAGALDLGEAYEYRGREGRRDIFVDPRQTDPGEAPTPLVDQRRLIDEFRTLIMDLREKWDHSLSNDVSMFDRIELQRAVSAGLADFETRTKNVTQNKLIRNPALNARWYKEVQMPYKDLVALVKKDEGQRNRYLPKSEFISLAKSMKTKLAEGELEGVVAHHSQVQNRINVPKGHPLYRLRLEIEGLVVRAKIALEFSSIPLTISGVLVNKGGKSGVILNGEVLEEGEYINETLFVKAVREDEVEFVYKGFTLVKTW